MVVIDSEGSPNVHSAIPLSPNGPKRPWFARLFDFKPQPLTFRSNWPAAETQDRLEAILKDLFGSSIAFESLKRPSCGVKCRYEGGVNIVLFFFKKKKKKGGQKFYILLAADKDILFSDERPSYQSSQVQD